MYVRMYVNASVLKSSHAVHRVPIYDTVIRVSRNVVVEYVPVRTVVVRTYLCYCYYKAYSMYVVT
jgi:hypothetical protein